MSAMGISTHSAYERSAILRSTVLIIHSLLYIIHHRSKYLRVCLGVDRDNVKFTIHSINVGCNVTLRWIMNWKQLSLVAFRLETEWDAIIVPAWGVYWVSILRSCLPRFAETHETCALAWWMKLVVLGWLSDKRRKKGNEVFELALFDSGFFFSSLEPLRYELDFQVLSLLTTTSRVGNVFSRMAVVVVVGGSFSFFFFCVLVSMTASEIFGVFSLPCWYW